MFLLQPSSFLTYCGLVMHICIISGNGLTSVPLNLNQTKTLIPENAFENVDKMSRILSRAWIEKTFLCWLTRISNLAFDLLVTQAPNK